MTEEDVYEKWKAERASIEAPTGFESTVLDRIAEHDSHDLVVTTGTKRQMLESPLWAAVAIVAASVFGFVRVAFALLVGIS